MRSVTYFEHAQSHNIFKRGWDSLTPRGRLWIGGGAIALASVGVANWATGSSPNYEATPLPEAEVQLGPNEDENSYVVETRLGPVVCWGSQKFYLAQDSTVSHLILQHTDFVDSSTTDDIVWTAGAKIDVAEGVGSRNKYPDARFIPADTLVELPLSCETPQG